LGQKVKVKVVRVNLEERKIDFELIEKGSSKSVTPKPRRSAKASDDRSNKSRSKKIRANSSGARKTSGKRSRAKTKAGSSSAKRKRKSKR
jgi:ribonuclease R